MLHELFLLLAGHPSPLFTPKLPLAFPLISPSERALLDDLARLGHYHRTIRIRCDLITSSHPSTIGRATASGLLTHLQKFRSQVSETERLILKRDDTVVGAYDIIPLAKIVSLFSGWLRILRYLDELVYVIIHGNVSEELQEVESGEVDTAALIAVMAEKGIRGAKLINRLRDDIHTGFPSIEEIALDLLNVAEMAWLRQVSTWVLYGRLPTFGALDFLVREVTPDEEEEGIKDFALSQSNIPAFVSPATSSSILFIGRALSQIRVKGDGHPETMKSPSKALNSEKSLLQIHLAILQGMSTPLSPALFHSAINAIRDSLSRNTLQRLLPSEETVDIIHVLREFYLLGRGEFAIALVEQADERIRGRWRRTGTSNTATPASSLSGMVIKEGEVGGVLKRTWATLSSFQNEEEHDERLDRAKDLLYLSLRKPPKAKGTPSTEPKKAKSSKEVERTIFNDLLVGVPISINFNLTWPLELFLTPQDLDIYESLFHYLLTIRRAQMKLQSLWQSRRNNAVLGIARQNVKAEIKRRREALRERERRQKSAWATASLCIFFLESVGVYFQGNVISASFSELENMIGLNTPDKDPENPSDDKEIQIGSPLRGLAHRRTPSSPSKRVVTPAARPQTPRTPIMSPTKAKFNFTSPLKSRQISAATTPRPLTPAGHDALVPKQELNPEITSLAHHQYLENLAHQVFLNDLMFTSLLRTFLISCDVLVTRITALAKSNEVLELLDQDVEDSREEEDVDALDHLCKELRVLLGSLIQRLQEMDDERSREGGGVKKGKKGLEEVGGPKVEAAPTLLGGALSGAGIDKLLMKLDFGNLRLS